MSLTDPSTWPVLKYLTDLSDKTRQELQSLLSQLTAYLGQEHTPTGAHAAVTATSLALTGAITIGERTQLLTPGSATIPTATDVLRDGDANGPRYTVYRVNPPANATIQTIFATNSDLIAGQLIMLLNVSAFTITLKHRATGGIGDVTTSGSGDYVIAAGESVMLWFDRATRTWWMVGTSTAPVTPGGSPSAPDQSVQFNEGGAFGGDAEFTYSTAEHVLTLSGALTGSHIAVLDIESTLNPTANTNVKFNIYSYIEIPSGSTKNVSNSYNGLYSEANNQGSGTVQQMFGVDAYATVSGSGPITQGATALRGTTSHSGSGNLQYVAGLDASVSYSGTGTLSTGVFGATITASHNASAHTNPALYGIFVQANGGTHTTDVYGIKILSSGATGILRGIHSDAPIEANALITTPVTFANLPAAPTEGMMVAITDSTTNVWGAVITGTGANHVLGYYNGTNWTVMAK